MPTSGEATSAKKTLGPKSRSFSNVKVTKSAYSRLPVDKKSSFNRGKENTEPRKKLIKAKPAPDFSKLHNKWKEEFEKGKAFTKKTNTKKKPFVLTENHGIKERLQPHINHDDDRANLAIVKKSRADDEFEIDPSALQGILSNTGIEVQDKINQPQKRATFAAAKQSSQIKISRYSTKRTSIYYMGGDKENSRPKGFSRELFSISSSLLANNITKHPNNMDRGQASQEYFVDEKDHDDEISFKPDAIALESILNNKGIDNQSLSRNNMGSTRTLPLSKRQSLFDDKRTSIYYSGSRTLKTVADASRLSFPASTSNKPNFKPILSAPSKPLSASYKPQYAIGSTVVGFQDMPFKEHKDRDGSTFAMPILPEQRNETQRPETKSSISALMTPSRSIGHTKQTIGEQNKNEENENDQATFSALMTPGRGHLNSKGHVPSFTKKHVTWSAILTPHRDHQGIDSKGGSVPKKSTRRKDATCSPVLHSVLNDNKPDVCIADSPTMDCLPVAMKRFSNDNTTTKTKKEKLEEFERKAIEDLQSLKLKENQYVQLSGKLISRVVKNKEIKTTPSINVSGCVLLTSPPELECTPKEYITPFKVPCKSQQGSIHTDQWIVVTPENHTRVASRKPKFSNKVMEKPHDLQLKEPQTFDTFDFVFPNDTRTPVRISSAAVNGEVPFGLLSSITKNEAKHPAAKTFLNSSGETLVSSSPGITFGSFASQSLPLCNNVNQKNTHGQTLANTKTTGNEHNRCIAEEVTTWCYEPERFSYSVNCNFSSKRNAESTPLKRDSPRNILKSIDCGELETLPSTSSVKPKVKRVNCIYPDSGVTEIKTRQPSSVKDVSLPAISLTEQALLDAEVTLFTCLGKRNQKTCHRSLVNPLNMLFSDGDCQHFVPVCLCTDAINCPVHTDIHSKQPDTNHR